MNLLDKLLRRGARAQTSTADEQRRRKYAEAAREREYVAQWDPNAAREARR